MLTHACGKMPGCFADITGITARTCKLVYNTRTKPKMHKDRGPNSAPPFRPIVSSIGTYNYNLAKYLCNLLSPHIPTEHCATDTFSFVQDIQSLSMFGKFMVSFDVESLFTNIPLEECIDLAVNYISEGNPDLKLSESELRSLFTIATAQTHFLFNGSFYDQIDGVAMGSPLAPVLANLFMGHHEKLWLENFQGSEILFYRRYVDDTFCLFHSEHDAITFFSITLTLDTLTLGLLWKKKLITNYRF